MIAAEGAVTDIAASFSLERVWKDPEITAHNIVSNKHWSMICEGSAPLLREANLLSKKWYLFRLFLGSEFQFAEYWALIDDNCGIDYIIYDDTFMVDKLLESHRCCSAITIWWPIDDDNIASAPLSICTCLWINSWIVQLRVLQIKVTIISRLHDSRNYSSFA